MNAPIYRETHAGDATERTSAAWKMAALIDAMATTDDPEVIVEFEERLSETYGDFGQWAVKLLDRANDVEATVGSIDAEITRLRALKAQREARAERLRGAIVRYMSETACTELFTDLYTVKLRKNPPSVEITDEAIIPAAYRKVVVKETETIDKKAIAEALKHGNLVDGANLVTRFRLEVK